MARSLKRQPFFEPAAAGLNQGSIRWDSEGRGDSPEMDADAAGKIIIQCPACQTKFAVELETIAAIDLPRFHCSRCDNIFSREEDLLDPPEDIPLPTDSAPADPLPAMTGESSEDWSAPLPSSAIPGFEYGGDVDESEPSSWALGPQLPEQLPEPFTAAPSRALEIPDAGRSSSASAAPHENRPAEGSRKPPADRQMELDFRKSVSSFSGRGEAEDPKSAARSAMKPGRGFSFSKLREHAQREPAAQTAARKSDELPDELEQLAQARRSSPWRATALVAVPLLVFLGLLGVGSYYLHRNAVLADRLLGSSLAEVAPPELTLRDLTCSSLELESGEHVHVIKGSLKNESERSFSEVVVEGAAFNADGAKLTEARAPAGSTLAKARIRALSLDMIRELQSRGALQKFQLKPGSEKKFALALLNAPGDAPLTRAALSKARYFSARVYSVK